MPRRVDERVDHLGIERAPVTPGGRASASSASGGTSLRWTFGMVVMVSICSSAPPSRKTSRAVLSVTVGAMSSKASARPSTQKAAASPLGLPDRP